MAIPLSVLLEVFTVGDATPPYHRGESPPVLSPRDRINRVFNGPFNKRTGQRPQPTRVMHDGRREEKG